MKLKILLCALTVLTGGLQAVSDQLMITKSDGTLLIIDCSNISDLAFSGQMSIPEELLVAQLFNLKQNYPNPFNPSTTIEFVLVKAGNAEVAVFNSNGQKIRTLLSGNLPAGSHRTAWNGTDQNNTQVASGTYFYKVEMDGQVQFKRMLLLK